MLSLELLAHRERDCTLVQGLISLVCLLDIIPDSSEKQATNRLIQGDLSDDLVEALSEEFFSNRAESVVSGLSLKQLLVEHLSETCHIDPCRLLRAHVLNGVLTLLDPLTRRQQRVKDIVRDQGLVLKGRQRSFFHRSYIFKKARMHRLVTSSSDNGQNRPKHFGCRDLFSSLRFRP